MIQRDCFAYKKDSYCVALNELVCADKKVQLLQNEKTVFRGFAEISAHKGR